MATAIIRCSVCMTTFDEHRWATLDLLERLGAGEIGQLLRGWPSDDCIEVRECRRCGKPVAARRRLALVTNEHGSNVPEQRHGEEDGHAGRE